MAAALRPDPAPGPRRQGAAASDCGRAALVSGNQQVVPSLREALSQRAARRVSPWWCKAVSAVTGGRVCVCGDPGGPRWHPRDSTSDTLSDMQQPAR